MSSSELPSPQFDPNLTTLASGNNLGSVEDGVPSSDERTLAMLAELLQLFSWIIGPLIIYFAKRDSRFVRFHALQAILWQVVVIIFYVVFFVVMIAGFIAAIPRNGGSPPNPSSAFPFVVLFCLYGFMGLTWIATMILAIYFAVKAQSGTWASYPVIGRLARRMAGV